jgi:benzoyl-CoA-dihydrodiol lyase
VLPGTGGLTRVTDKRKVRRDLADVFCTTEEGVRGKRAVQWRLVDEVIPPSAWHEKVASRALELAEKSDRPRDAQGVKFTELAREITDTTIVYTHVRVELDRDKRRATLTIAGPTDAPPAAAAAAQALGDKFWPLAMARDLEDAILHLRLNEPELGLWAFRTEGDGKSVLAYDDFLAANRSHWLMREITHYLKRTLKRVDVTSRSLIALIEPGSCFAGTLAELAFASDRALMFNGSRAGDNRPPAAIMLGSANFGPYPMANALTRLQTRFLGEPATLTKAQAAQHQPLDADAANELGLVTAVFDETDWNDEIRIMLEERASFSPDSLTGLEANLRFAGPETMETRVFGRLTAWQNWIFQRPNAVGEDGALKRYGSGQQPVYDRNRV